MYCVSGPNVAMSWREKFRQKLTIRNSNGRSFLAEMLGTFLLCTFGNGSVAQSVLSGGANGGFLSVNWGFGVGVTMGVYVSASTSGGHLNPAVSIAMTILGKLKLYKLPIYVAAQCLGAFVSSGVLYLVYLDSMNNFDGGNRTTTGPTATAGIFATYPQDHVGWGGALADQIIGTMLLMICVLAVTDKRNVDLPSGLVPFIVGLIVFVIGTSFGYNCGYAINPARDLAPRIFTAIAGWGSPPFSFRGYNWFWIPIVGPIVGAVVGACVFPLMVGLHLGGHGMNSRQRSVEEKIRLEEDAVN